MVQVANLLIVRLAKDQDGGTIPEKPDRYKVGTTVGPNAAKPNNRLSSQTLIDMGIFLILQVKHLSLPFKKYHIRDPLSIIHAILHFKGSQQSSVPL